MLQVLPKADVLKRLSFYSSQKLAFVARPAEDRRGLFKKASNMNYALNVAEDVKVRLYA